MGSIMPVCIEFCDRKSIFVNPNHTKILYLNEILELKEDTISSDEGAIMDESGPDKRLPSKIPSFLNINLAAVADKMIEDEGELYDGEKEGGDIRNESSAQKRPAGSPGTTTTDAKKTKTEDEEPTPME